MEISLLQRHGVLWPHPCSWKRSCERIRSAAAQGALSAKGHNNGLAAFVIARNTTLIEQVAWSAVGPIASPRLSRRHIGGFTPSAPITTAAASEPSFFITTKTLRPTAS
jgi:hypothetical protein